MSSTLAPNQPRKEFPQGNYTKLNNAIIELYLPQLKPRQLRVLLVLAYCADNTTQVAECTQRWIAETVGCTEKWVREALYGLATLGLIERVGRRYRMLPVPLESGTPEHLKPELQRTPNRNSRGHKPEFQRTVVLNQTINQTMTRQDPPNPPSQAKGGSGASLALVPDSRHDQYRADRKKRRLDNWQAKKNGEQAYDQYRASQSALKEEIEALNGAHLNREEAEAVVREFQSERKLPN